MKTASIFEELEGRTIDGKFALLEKLGGAEDTGVFLTLRLGGQRAVIKLIRAEGAEANAILARWDAAKALAHPHLIRVFESGRTAVNSAQFVYVVTENADDVLSNIVRERALDPLETRDTFGPILDALSYLHATGIVHGHVKPSNALRVGEAVKLSTDDLLLVPGSPRRAPKHTAYDAPELSSGKVTPAADVWSIGMMLCEVVTQQLPNLSADGGLVVPDSLPKSFASIAEECLRFKPDQRCTISDIIPRLAPGLSLPAEFFSGPARPNPGPHQPVPDNPASSFSPEDLKIVEALNALPATDNDVAPRNLAPAAPSRWQQDEPDSAPINQFSPEPTRRAASPAVSQPRPVTNWQSKWESETSAPLPELFSQYKEKEPRRSHAAPFLLAALVLIAFAAVMLIRSGKLDITQLQHLAQEKYDALTHSAQPEPRAQTSAPQPDATQPAPPSQTPPATVQSNTQPLEPSASTPQPPSTTASPAAAAPEPQSQALATQPAESASAPAPIQSPVPPPAPSQTEPSLPANADGAVAHQVMPSVSQAAIESMHGPVRVIIRVDVSQKGNVSRAAYVSPGEGNYFARISRRAAEEWKFQPPRAHSRSLTSVWTLHFYFSGSNVDVTAVQDEP